jgi:hypothetical protein
MKTYVVVICLSALILAGSMHAEACLHKEGMLVVVTELTMPFESSYSEVSFFQEETPPLEGSGANLPTANLLPEPSFSFAGPQSDAGPTDMISSLPEMPVMRLKILQNVDIETCGTSEVPEPGTLSLLLLGLIGMAGIARKNNLF